MTNLASSITGFVSSKKAMTILSLLGLYLISTGISWGMFSYLKGEPQLVSSNDLLTKISQLPKTEECPINGAMYTSLERDIWEERRPITAVVENHQESRPQSGLSFADVVY